VAIIKVVAKSRLKRVNAKPESIWRRQRNTEDYWRQRTGERIGSKLACVTALLPYTVRMRNIVLAFALSASLVSAAEVNVEIVFDQEQFLRSESLPLRLRISNFSGQPLKLGVESNWLAFVVEGRQGIPLAQTGEMPPTKPFALESSKTASLTMDLMPYFNLSEPGHYSVSATVRVPEIGKELTTAAKGFDIVSGAKLWEREFGLPGTQPPVVRKFALQQATFLKQLKLYVRVTDPNESEVFRVLPLGALVSFSTPEATLDKSSNLHVLFQNGPRGFLYSVIATDGDQIIRQTWDQTTTRPRLLSESDGRVVVQGGARRILLSDLPPPPVAHTNDTVQSK
jgi:hypothetical protein